jgi:hypothetical protein
MISKRERLGSLVFNVTVEGEKEGERAKIRNLCSIIGKITNRFLPPLVFIPVISSLKSYLR